MNRKELLNRAVNEGLQSLLAELLATSKRCDIGGRKHGKRWVAA
jgi:hypothetical protein